MGDDETIFEGADHIVKVRSVSQRLAAVRKRAQLWALGLGRRQLSLQLAKLVVQVGRYAAVDVQLGVQALVFVLGRRQPGVQPVERD